MFISPFVQMLFRLNIGDYSQVHKRLLSNLGINCWDALHQTFVFSLLIPIIIIVGVLLPFYILYNILRARKEIQLNNPDFVRNFGYFLDPYRERTNYFEIFNIWNKICIVLLHNILF